MCLSLHFFPNCFPSSLSWAGGSHWLEGEGSLNGKGAGKRPLGAWEDKGPLEWEVMQETWVDTQSWRCSEALDGRDFPRWPLGIWALSPTFQPAPALFLQSLDSSGPQPCILATPPALGCGRGGHHELGISPGWIVGKGFRIL